MIRLHHCKQTRSMRVHWLLGEIGVPFESRVWPFDRTLRQDEYLQLSPAGRVPSLEDGDLTMYESGAIVEYLCERFRIPDSGALPAIPNGRVGSCGSISRRPSPSILPI